MGHMAFMMWVSFIKSRKRRSDGRYKFFALCFVVAHAHGVAYTGPKDCVEREKLKGIIKLVADDLEKKGLIHGSKISGNTDGETVK